MSPELQWIVGAWIVPLLAGGPRDEGGRGGCANSPRRQMPNDRRRFVRNLLRLARRTDGGVRMECVRSSRTPLDRPKRRSVPPQARGQKTLLQIQAVEDLGYAGWFFGAFYLECDVEGGLQTAGDFVDRGQSSAGPQFGTHWHR